MVYYTNIYLYKYWQAKCYFPPGPQWTCIVYIYKLESDFPVVYTEWHLATVRPHYGSFRGSPFRDISGFFVGNAWTSDESRGMPEHPYRQTIQRQARKLTEKKVTLFFINNLKKNKTELYLCYNDW